MYNTYLPWIGKSIEPKVVGVQIDGLQESEVEFLVPRSSVLFNLKWYECEDNFDHVIPFWELIKTRDIVIQVKNAPEYMRTVPDKKCSPPKPKYYESFAMFLLRVCETFNPLAIEIWNEPDAAIDAMYPGHDEYYGCWGKTDNMFNAGLEYGNFLGVVYPIVKEAFPDVQLFAGALSMHGDSDNFINGFTLRGEYDIISYHAYPYYHEDDYNKIKTYKDRIQQYDKHTPLAVTETSLLWWGDSKPTDEFEQAQAAYYLDSIQYAKDEEIDWLFWYELNNTWKHCGLCEGGIRKPAWYSYKCYFIS